jgi:hypothetical protein
MVLFGQEKLGIAGQHDAALSADMWRRGSAKRMQYIQDMILFDE